MGGWGQWAVEGEENAYTVLLIRIASLCSLLAELDLVVVLSILLITNANLLSLLLKFM